MRILLLTHSFWPDASPPQRRWEQFGFVFSEAGHTIDVITPEVGHQSQVPGPLDVVSTPGINLIRYPSSGLRPTLFGKIVNNAIGAVRSMPLAMQTRRPDVVIATVPALPTLFVGYWISRLRRLPLVVELRDVWPDLLHDSRVLRSGFLSRVVAHAFTGMIRNSDLVVTVSQGFAKNLSSGGVHRVVTISNGVDTSRYINKLPSISRGPKLRVLYLGNLGKSQGLDLVIRAVATLRIEVEFRIVGQGTEKARLVQLATTLKADVEFCKPVYDARVLDHYAWADTCVVSLRSDWESFQHTIPSKLYELMFFDKHVTGLVQGEAARIIETSKAGTVVEQNEASLITHFRTLQQERTLTDTGNAGSDWVRRHASLSLLGVQYLEYLDYIISLRRESS